LDCSKALFRRLIRSPSPFLSLILSLNYFQRTRSNFRSNLTNLVGLFEREKDFTANSLTLSISFCNFRCFLLTGVSSSSFSVALVLGDESYHSVGGLGESTGVLEICEEVFGRSPQDLTQRAWRKAEEGTG